MFNLTLILPHKYGFKLINPHITLSTNQNHNSNLVLIPINELRFSMDNLIDEYSLLNYKVIKTPHYDLMVKLLEKKSIIESIYIKRSKKGNLDGRLAFNLKEAWYKETFYKRLQQIQNSDNSHITVFEKGPYKYIVDGKHRAALAAALGNETILAKVVVRNFEDPVYIKIHKKMLRSKKRKFELHKEFILNYL